MMIRGLREFDGDEAEGDTRGRGFVGGGNFRWYEEWIYIYMYVYVSVPIPSFSTSIFDLRVSCCPRQTASWLPPFRSPCRRTLRLALAFRSPPLVSLPLVEQCRCCSCRCKLPWASNDSFNSPRVRLTSKSRLLLTLSSLLSYPPPPPLLLRSLSHTQIPLRSSVPPFLFLSPSKLPPPLSLSLSLSLSYSLTHSLTHCSTPELLPRSLHLRTLSFTHTHTHTRSRTSLSMTKLCQACQPELQLPLTVIRVPV